MEMHDPNIVPVVGRTFEVNFGEFVFHTTFDSDSKLTFKPIKGALGTVETVGYKKVEIGPNAYLLSWQEKDKTTVTGYWNFQKQVVYSNVTLPDNTFLNLKGNLRPLN